MRNDVCNLCIKMMFLFPQAAPRLPSSRLNGPSRAAPGGRCRGRRAEAAAGVEGRVIIAELARSSTALRPRPPGAVSAGQTISAGSSTPFATRAPNGTSTKFNHHSSSAVASGQLPTLCRPEHMTARCVSHSYIHVTNGSKPQIGNASVARDAAQTELGEHRRPF